MTSPNSSMVGNLSFRRQFIFGPRFSDFLPTWKRHQVGDRIMLSVHPDLGCVRADVGERSLILLGFVLDPRHPDRGDETILKIVLRETRTFDEALSRFDDFAGRWAVIYISGDQVSVFHDAAGLRQVYHGRDPAGEIWCASTPNLLARVTDANEDAENREEMRRAGVFKPRANFFWPGSGSAFCGIDRLLPNHYLDLHSGRVERFWPRSSIPRMDDDAAVAVCAETLAGVIGAAAARYQLALAITAGIDSRILLAASREHAGQLVFYTLKRPTMNRRSGDLRVPRKMMRSQGRPHKVIKVQAMSAGPVADAIYSTFSPFHQLTVDESSAMYSDPPISDGDWVTINGNVSEVARCYLKRLAVTPENLAINAGMGGSAFAAAELAAWYETARPAIDASGIDPWDLFYWEQKMGGWLATVRTEFDVVEEGVTPYNSRSLLQYMLGVDPALRCAPDYRFFRSIISYLWPEMLNYPINPPGKREILKTRYRSAVKGVTEFIAASPARLRPGPRA